MNLALRCGRGHSWAKVTRGPSSQRHVEICTSNSLAACDTILTDTSPDKADDARAALSDQIVG